MESERCKTIVKEELNKLGLLYKSVELGEVDLIKNISEEQLQSVSYALNKSGLELMIDQKKMLIEKIKASINQLVNFSDDLKRPKCSSYISKQVNYDYNCLSKTFSEMEGITIEKYLIMQRIDRVKELLVYGELSLSEISYKLLYSSVAHLSNQFKKVTGLTPFNFRQLVDKRSKKMSMGE
jgi:AraC-like DNA-binding protein